MFGLFLISINIIGEFRDLRNKDILNEKNNYFYDDIILSYHQVINIINETKGMNKKEYASRINDAVHNGVAHYWAEEGRERYNLRVPVWENYFLYFFQFVFPKKYSLYEFLDYHKALERGVGLCSQHAIIVSGILNDHNITTDIIDLGGHVIARAQINTNTYVLLDADFGIVMPFDISHVERNPEVVIDYYDSIKSKIKGTEPPLEQWLKNTYDKEGNVIFHGGIASYGPQKYWIEKGAYAAKWIFPILLIIPYVMSYIKKRSSKNVS